LTVSAPAEVLPASARLVEVCLRFGVPMSSPGWQIVSGLELSFAPGTITLISGPSGSGKSLLLSEIGKHFPTSREVNQIAFPLDVSVLDAIAPTRPLDEALHLLSAAGLGEPMLWVRGFAHLSEGEQFRARMARAIWLHRRNGRSGPLLCDEFGAILHTRLAKVLAFNLRKLVSREGLSLVVATCRDDLERDLCPDQVVRLGDREPVVERRDQKTAKRQAGLSTTRVHRLPRISFVRRLRIERGTVRDYANFSSMHYRQRNQLGYVSRVYVMREGVGGDPLGIVVYGHPIIGLALRNKATGGRYICQVKRLNREVRVLKRLVIHPDVRGCGLGHWLVNRTLPMVGVRFVECLATMGVVNPVFEKAGMQQIGICEPPASLRQTMVNLRSAGVDTTSSDYLSQVRRRPSIRRAIAAAVKDWYRRTTSDGQSRVSKQSPTALAQTFRQMAGCRPVYYIWARDKKGWALIKAGLAGTNAGDRAAETPMGTA
jgi:ABC-type lipoprotein export system ATPase subunit/GNAT superfamily N-acetyltransferase